MVMGDVIQYPTRSWKTYDFSIFDPWFLYGESRANHVRGLLSMMEIHLDNLDGYQCLLLLGL